MITKISIDSVTCHAVQIGELLLELMREQNTMLIVVTHSLELAQQMDRQMELRDGQLHDV